MYCENCGHELKDDALFCDECGYEVNYQDLPQNDVANRTVWTDAPMDISYQTATLPRVGQKRHIKLMAGVAAAAVVLAGAFFLLSFKQRSNGFQFKTDYHLYDASYDYIIMTDDNDHYGVLDFKGKVVIPFEYDKMEFLDKDQRSDLFLMRKNSGCGVISAHNKMTLTPHYDAVGYFPDYDSIYAIGLLEKEIAVFRADGSEVGTVSYQSKGNYIRFYDNFICNSHVKVVTDVSLYGYLQKEDLNIMGLLSPNRIAIRTKSELRVVDLTTQETLQSASSQGFGCVLNSAVYTNNPKNNYYCVYPLGAYDVHAGYLIDSNGNNVDYAIVKDSNGNDLMQFTLADYKFAMLLDDNGLCVLRQENEGILKNIKSGNVISKFDHIYYNSEEQIVILQTLEETTETYTAYNYAGKKLHEFGSFYNCSRTGLKNTVNHRLFFGLGADGLYMADVSLEGNDNLFFYVKYVNAYGKTKDLGKWDYLLNEFSEVPAFRDPDLQKDVVYYRSFDGSYGTVLNNLGDVLFTERDIGFFKSSSTNNQGICIQKDEGEIYWYNRTDKTKGVWNFHLGKTDNSRTDEAKAQAETDETGSQTATSQRAATTVTTTQTADSPDSTTQQTTQTTDASQQSSYDVGQEVMMGEYEQDNNFSNGKEPLKWTVLDVQGDKALLIAHDLIDYIPYHERRTDITWEDCSLRKWMNKDFYETAFSTQEQSRILTTHLINHDNVTGTDGGNDTDDKIFALSVDEANRYFASDAERVAYYTDYVESYHYVTEKARGREWWWLRSPGVSPQLAALVNVEGEIIEVKGDYVEDYDITVRPAMWISI